MEAGRQVKDFEEWFRDEHPIWTGVILTVVVLGILYLTYPYILAALGFEEIGIVEGVFFYWISETFSPVPVKYLLSIYLSESLFLLARHYYLCRLHTSIGS